MPSVHGLQIAFPASGPTLTFDQKRFNTLVRQIERARETLKAWKDNVPLFQQSYVQIVLPLQTSCKAACRRWVFALDTLFDQPGWTRTERATLRELVCESTGALLETDKDDATLKALFDKHSRIDFATRRQEELKVMKGLTEVFTGLDLGDDAGIRTHEDLFQRMSEKMAQSADDSEPQRPSRRKSRRQTLAEERRETETKLATQSVREIYRKLVSALHPDREPDTARREAKTALMQKINQAYEANDLLTLLEAQLRIEQVDTSHIAGDDPQRLKRYNKILSEQLLGLKAEIHGLEMRFRIDFTVEPGASLNPHRLGTLIDAETRVLRQELNRQEQALRLLDDRIATKQWLIQERRAMREEARYEGFF